MQNNEIAMDLEDYKAILKHYGKIDGRVGICKIDDFKNQLDESFKDSLSKAKGITIKFGIQNTQLLIKLGDILDEINDLSSVDTEIIFGVEQIEGIEKESFKYEIITTGL